MHKVSFLAHIRMPKISAKTYAKTVLMQNSTQKNIIKQFF